MLADVARNCRAPYAASRLLAAARLDPAAATAAAFPAAAAAPADDDCIAGAVPGPPDPKRPPAVVCLVVMLDPRRAVDVGDLARSDRLSRSTVRQHLTVLWVVDRARLVLAVRAQTA